MLNSVRKIVYSIELGIFNPFLGNIREKKAELFFMTVVDKYFHKKKYKNILKSSSNIHFVTLIL